MKSIIIITVIFSLLIIFTYRSNIFTQLLHIPPFNIIYKMQQKNGTNNVVIDYNKLRSNFICLFIISFISIGSFIYYIYFNNNNNTINGGNSFEKININKNEDFENLSFKKYYII
jgi:hypothetical protein